MRLRDLKRFCRALVPNVRVRMRRDMPPSLYGLAKPGDAVSFIIYAPKLGERQRDLTILHELAHLLFDADDHQPPFEQFARWESHRVANQWREDRADRWAEQTLELLETGTV